MKNICLSLLIVLGAGLTGCASLPSKPLTYDQLGKYETYPLNASSFRVSFEGRRDMSFATAEEITLLKAAQVAVQNGYQYFKVLDTPSNATPRPPRQAVVYPAPLYAPYGYYRHYPFYDPFYNMPQVVTIEPTQVSYSIECYKDQKTAPKEAFDARLILKSLGAKYGLNSSGEVLQPTPVAAK
ncbi:CC0125/CC1285 family lipoprotein [Acinetobacter larvae]|uniref:DUF4136 domain-containing protein n=1 Tax=Acinetobacter larvae TaxID=1789224 RepID=A0A1B2M3E7_9GAMM|nr:hypothetical protein [Acinetobacter larvae]AOA59709.1 hypothetical protein BFG52_16050 [Acinetobacter larvae]